MAQCLGCLVILVLGSHLVLLKADRPVSEMIGVYKSLSGDDLEDSLRKIPKRGDKGASLLEERAALDAAKADAEAASSAKAAEADGTAEETEQKVEGEVKSAAEDEADAEAASSAEASEADGEAEETEQKVDGDMNSGVEDEALEVESVHSSIDKSKTLNSTTELAVKGDLRVGGIKGLIISALLLGSANAFGPSFSSPAAKQAGVSNYHTE